MSGLKSFVKKLFGQLAPASAPAARPAVPVSQPTAAPATPARTSPARARDMVLAQLGGQVLMKFSDFGIAVPPGSPTCCSCTRPTYNNAAGEGKLVMIEGSQNDMPLRRKAGKAFVLAAGTVCKACQTRLCWHCVVTVGLGSCPNCNQPIDEDPTHGLSADTLLAEAQKSQVIETVVLARHEGDAESALERTARQLIAKGWDDRDAYFGRLYARQVVQAIASGRVDEAAYLAELRRAAPQRTIVEFPNSKTGETFRVVMGTAYAEDVGGLGQRVMAECEDGQVRCVNDGTFMSEVFVDLINGKRPQQ